MEDLRFKVPKMHRKTQEKSKKVIETRQFSRWRMYLATASVADWTCSFS